MAKRSLSDNANIFRDEVIDIIKLYELLKEFPGQFKSARDRVFTLPGMSNAPIGAIVEKIAESLNSDMKKIEELALQVFDNLEGAVSAGVAYACEAYGNDVKRITLARQVFNEDIQPFMNVMHLAKQSLDEIEQNIADGYTVNENIYGEFRRAIADALYGIKHLMHEEEHLFNNFFSRTHMLILGEIPNMAGRSTHL